MVLKPWLSRRGAKSYTPLAEKAHRGYFTGNNFFLKKITFPAILRDLSKINFTKLKIKHCTVLCISLLQPVQKYVRWSYLTGRQELPPHAAIIPQPSPSWEEEFPEREPGHVKRICPQFSWTTTLQLGLGLKNQHCLRNDWTAFAWGWNRITVSKPALSSNGLPGESVLTLSNKLIEFEMCYWATHTLSRGTARVTCTAILVEFWKSQNATWNARTAQGSWPLGSSFFCLFRLSLTAFITQQIQI